MPELSLYWQDFHFLRPWASLLLIPVIILYCLAKWQSTIASRWGQFLKKEYLEVLAVDSVTQSWLNPAKLMLMSCVIACLAAAGPSWQMRANPLQQNQQAIFIALQLNETMQDDAAGQLVRAKLKIAAFLEANKSLPVGLLVFSGSAHHVLPLSMDQQAVHLYLADLQAKLMPEEGFRPDLAMTEIYRQADLTRFPQSTIIVVGNDETLRGEADFVGAELDLLRIHWSVANVELDTFYQERSFVQVPMSQESDDIERISWLIKNRFRKKSQGEEDSWQDAGYFMVWPLLFFTLLWFRRGMVMNWS